MISVELDRDSSAQWIIQSVSFKTGEEGQKSEMAVIFRKDFKEKVWALIYSWHFKMRWMMLSLCGHFRF